MKLKLLYSDLKSDLDIIEKELATAVNSSSHLLNDASLHLLLAGGKRIRPVFVLLAANFGYLFDRNDQECSCSSRAYTYGFSCP